MENMREGQDEPQAWQISWGMGEPSRDCGKTTEKRLLKAAISYLELC